MGIDPAHLLNHSMYYNSAEEMVQQLHTVTGLPVFVARVSIAKDVASHLPPDAFNGWKIYSEDDNTLQDHLNAGDLIKVCRHNHTGDESFYLSPHLLEYYSEQVYMGRWFEVKYLADWIADNGIPSLADYDDKTKDLPYMLHNRKNLYEQCRPWGTTAMVTFCNDKHQDWLHYFAKEKWTLEDFVRWGKEKFLFTTFQNLPSFRFPENIADDYYEVFIYDDFSDLKTA